MRAGVKVWGSQLKNKTKRKLHITLIHWQRSSKNIYILKSLKRYHSVPDPCSTFGNFSNKPGRLKSMIWQARKHLFVLLIILLVMKVVLRHHVGSSAKLLSLILNILIGYVAKKRFKLANFWCHNHVTLSSH